MAYCRSVQVLCLLVIVFGGVGGSSVNKDEVIRIIAEDRDPNDLSMSLKNERRARDCGELQDEAPTQLRSGMYYIQPVGYKTPFPVYCDFAMTGGWTVIQRRTDGSVDFNRGWDAYKEGFGDLETSFWLGNDKISALTMQKRYQLRIELIGTYAPQYYALYSVFSVSDESNFYKLYVGTYSGNAGDSLKYHDGQYFSTNDADHDSYSDGECAASDYGGWWYNACVDSRLNGRYPDRIYWQHHPWGGHPMRFAEKIKAV